jgi:Glyoxalase-like domain
MTAQFQLVIDCADPEPLARFWVAALGYVFEPPPDGYDNWDDHWRAVGGSEDELGLGSDCIVDPAGRGPRIWFQVVPEKKKLKNRLHLDIMGGGGRSNPIETRRRLVDAEAQRLEALGATLVSISSPDGMNHYGAIMRDPEGNEFDVA